MHTSYCLELQVDTLSIELSEIESNHLVKVLRKQAGDQILLSNGKGLKAIGILNFAHPKKSLVTISEIKEKAAEKQKIHLAIAPTKNMDRLEWLVEKATEIGVDKITLLLCKNNERKYVKMERLEKIILSAMKQSQRFYLPELCDFVTVSDFVKNNPNGGLAHCYDHLEDNKISIRDWQPQEAILIGPEGDFTIDEVKLAMQAGYKTIDLGENRLRTETAAIFAVSCLAQRRI